MSGNKDFGSELERAIEQIKNEQVDPAAVEAAADRVWARIHDAKPQLVEKIRSCADFQALIPDYRAGKLSEARALLLKDHTHECVACRKALETASGKVTAFPAGARTGRKPMAPAWRWAIAATVLVGLGLTAWGVLSFGPQFGSRTQIQAVNGSLFRIAGQSLVPVTAGQILSGDEEIRTAKDSGAMVRLSDGSQVEMRERSGFRVSENLRDITVHLTRGSIIVQAAKRRSGHLYVATRECRVAVTGTIFSVNSGLKGSRVSVVEGEVHVDQAGTVAVLHSGDQFTSTPALERVPVQQEIAWSRNLDQHIAILKAMKALDKKLTETNFPKLRYGSKLMGLLPANTAVFASIPNLSEALAEAQQIFAARAQEDPALRQWWQDGEHKASDAIARMKTASAYLGDEIVMAAAAEGTGRVTAPVFVAELKDSGLRAFLDAELAKIPADKREHVTIVESAAAVPAATQGVVILAEPGLVAISPSAPALRQIAQTFESKSQGGLANTPFGAQLASVYAGGAGLLFSADLEKFGAMHRQEAAGDFLPKVKYLTIEQAGLKDKSEVRAVMSFQGERSGIASWIASPTPLGVLQYISPSAGIVLAGAIKQPALILDEIVKWKASHASQEESPHSLAELEAKLGISVRNDLAAPLGGEIALALDGPALPIPSWKVVAEVTDAVRLQNAITRLVQAGNAEMAAQGKPQVQMSEDKEGQYTFYTIRTPGATVVPEIDYVFSGGYLIAAPSRALLKSALSAAANGQSLATSAQFKSLLPRDGHLNASAIGYQNLASTLGPVADMIGAARGLTPDQQQGIKTFASELKPMLAAAYSETDRITVATTGSLLGLSINQFGLSRFFGPGAKRGEAHGTAHPQRAYPKER